MKNLLIGSVFYNFNLFSIITFIYSSYEDKKPISLFVKFPLTFVL